MNNISSNSHETGISRKQSQIVSLNTGFEAQSILLVNSDKPLVFKFIDGKKSWQESGHIKRVNSHVPGFFPDIVYESTTYINFYALEYVNGGSLYEIVKKDLLLKHTKNKDLVKRCLSKLRQLHTETKQQVTVNEYWKVIVNSRIDAFFTDSFHLLFDSLSSENLLEEVELISEYNNIDICYVLESAKASFIEYEPTNYSLIHGDPHLHNIIIDSGNPIFIDPRLEWDATPNQDNGIFDPLYDVACLTHSLIVEDIVQRSEEGEKFFNGRLRVSEHAQVLTQNYLDLASEVIALYLEGAEVKTTQPVHYMTYLACSLLGCLKYEQQIVDANMYRFVIYLAAKLVSLGLEQLNGSK